MKDNKFIRYTEREFNAAKKMRELLLDYYDTGHIVDLNVDVMVNKIGQLMYGSNIWKHMAKHMREEQAKDGE